MNLNDMKIGTRMWLGVGLLILSFTAVIGFANWRSAVAQAQSTADTAAIDDKLRIALEWAALTENNRTRTYATMISNEASVAQALAPAMADTTRTISGLQERLAAMTLTEADKRALEKIAAAREGMLAARKEAQALKSGGQSEDALRSIAQTYVPAADAYAQTQRDFVALQEAAKHDVIAAATAQRKATVVVASIVVLVVLVAIAVGAHVTIRSIRQPLDAAVALAARIAGGDLSARVTVTRRDEFGALMQSLRSMNESLHRMVMQVRASTDNIGTASAQIAGGTQDLSARTELQASNLQQTASSMEELSVTVKHSADSARQADQLAASAAQVATRGGAVVSEVVATMDDISASSSKIADIIGVIDGIAFQTNILALNAAVEAARAGEQGRGFAVVATEVRSLAQRSAGAAREIKQLIGASVERVEAGSRLVADAGRTMQELVGSVQRVSDIIGEITASAAEQSDGIGQINSAVAQLDQATQQNAALVEESTAAAQSLKEQAVTLASVMRNFKVDA